MGTGEDFAAEDALRKRLNETLSERDTLAKRVEELEDFILWCRGKDGVAGAIEMKSRGIAERRVGRAK